MAFLAAYPNQPFSTKELAEALHMQNGARGLSGLLGAFGRRASNRYGGRKPWQSDWDAYREKSIHYMDQEDADVIRELAAEEGF